MEADDAVPTVTAAGVDICAINQLVVSSRGISSSL
jgi:hypothetical protein